MSVRPDHTYDYQFATYFGELLEQNAAYKGAIIDGQIRIEKQEKELGEARTTLEASGINSSMRWSMIEKNIESVNLQKLGIKVEEQMTRNKIEILLQKVLAWFPEIQDDYSNNKISRMQFVNYLGKYKYLLHQGNRLGLACYGGVTINRINDSIENYKII